MYKVKEGTIEIRLGDIYLNNELTTNKIEVQPIKLPASLVQTEQGLMIEFQFDVPELNHKVTIKHLLDRNKENISQSQIGNYSLMNFTAFYHKEDTIIKALLTFQNEKLNRWEDYDDMLCFSNLDILREVKDMDGKCWKFEKFNPQIPNWHKSELEKRSEEFYANSTQVLNFNDAMDELEKEI